MTRSLRVVILVFLISLIAGAVSGFDFYFRLAYVCLFVIASSWGMSRLALRGIRLQRTSRTYRSQVGLIFEERYELSNQSRLPCIWVEVRDESSLPGTKGSHVLTMVGGLESRTYLSRTRLYRRGIFRLGPTILQSGDLFGLFPVRVEVPAENELLVYPAMVNITQFFLPLGLLPGGEALRRRTTQITSNAAGVREYAPGDPLNRIHWISTAKRDRLMVKEFELDPLADVFLFVDAMEAVHSQEEYEIPIFDPREVWRRKFVYELPPSTLEYAVTIAASLARYYLQRSRAVGLVVGDASLHLLPSERGGRQLGKILETLALIQGKGTTPLFYLIEAQARHMPRGSTVVIITPTDTDHIERMVDLLIRRGLRPVCVLLESKSFGGRSEASSLERVLLAFDVGVVTIRKADKLEEKLSIAAYDYRRGKLWGKDRLAG